MKHIKLTQGRFALVDNKDFEELNQYKWCGTKIHNVWYAIRHSPRNHYKRNMILMHRQILGLKLGDGIKSDHKDGNGLNNQQHNLRRCNNAENQYNRRPNKNHSSKYKGVSWKQNTYKGKQYKGKWLVDISYNHKHYKLGLFKSETKAALVYDRKAKELFGEFAYLNFPKHLQKREWPKGE